jgi:16S rRNA (guanine1516-N2)-methyltransferase
MTLCEPAARGGLVLELDVATGALARRIRDARRDEPLPRACGLHRRDAGALRVFDATAGLCRDAMVLAHLGCNVTAMERIAALAFLADAAIEDTWLAKNLEVLAGDSLERLRAWPHEPPHVVCLDPMFEETGKAQVKKDMQMCRALAGPPVDAVALLEQARRVASERVVVKRDPAAPPLAPGASFAVDGERVRFDVYLTAPAASPR